MASVYSDADFENFYARICGNASSITGVYPTTAGATTSKSPTIHIGSRSFDAEKLGALLEYLLDATPESQI